ncbi:MAG: DUF1573 domain-containing protein [Cytophagales bacterium]|nr:DUF1573 domain-containing protein [Cytophagales bacterium]
MKGIFATLLVGTTLLFSCGENTTQDVVDNSINEKKQEVKKDLPTMVFEETEYDFGKIMQGDTVEHIFTFKNTGNAPLTIYDAKAGCGCTIPQYEKGRLIAPGESGEIKVIFNSKGKRGTQTKNVDISTNMTDAKQTVIIKGEVIVPEKEEK